MKTPKNARNMAKILAALMGAGAVLAGCEGPVGPQGNPGQDGVNGENGRDAPNALIPLDFGGLKIFLKDETNRLDPVSIAIKFQNTLHDIDSDDASIATNLKTGGSLAIIIENAPAYDSGNDFRIIDKDTFAMRYDYVNSAVNIYLAVRGALVTITPAHTAMAPNNNALRLAMAPQKKVYAPLAEFGKRKNIQIQNRVAAAWSSRRYC